MFDSVAPRYDLLNRLLSGGRDVVWRRLAVFRLLGDEKGSYLDVATGTADVALEIRKQAPSAQVVGVDFSPNMLERARKKVANSGIGLIRGDALSLPFDDNSFDGSIAAYGVRNFSDRLQGLREMRRVVKPRGRVVVLEFSVPGGLLGDCYRVYFSNILPLVGGLISGDREAYGYLHDSVEAFPSPQIFCDLMVQAGLAKVRYYPLTFGISVCYLGEKEVAY